MSRVPRESPAVNATVVVLVLSLGSLAFSLLQLLVAPALTVIAADLGVTVTDAAWVLTAYLLSTAVLTPILGRLGDIIGKRRVLIGVLSLLLAGTILAAVAPSFGVLISARVLHGAGGSLVPISIGIVRDQLPADKVGLSIGVLSAIFGLGAGVGVIAAGPIVETLSWRWLFWIPSALVVIAIVGTLFGIGRATVRTPGRLDAAGAILLTVGLVCLLLAVSKGADWGWGSSPTLGLMGLGTVAMVSFLIVELRSAMPLIDVRLIGLRGVWNAHAVALFFGFATFGTFVLMPALLLLPTSTGHGFGLSVSAAALFLLPTVLALTIGGLLAGALLRTFDARALMVAGGALLTVGFAIPAIDHGQLWVIAASGLLSGGGIGLATASLSKALVDIVPASSTSAVLSVNAIIRTIGGSLGTALLAAIIAFDPSGQGSAPDAGFTAAFWTCAGVGVVAMIAAVVSPSTSDSGRP